MRNYEVALIAHPDLNDEAVTGLIDRLKGWIAAGGGTVGSIDQWGRRRLAYRIRKQQEGQYIFVPAQMPPTATRELERNLRLTEPILRFLITQAE
jgi:small subunit ribosomal protein S6